MLKWWALQLTLEFPSDAHLLCSHWHCLLLLHAAPLKEQQPGLLQPCADMRYVCPYLMSVTVSILHGMNNFSLQRDFLGSKPLNKEKGQKKVPITASC